MPDERRSLPRAQPPQHDGMAYAGDNPCRAPALGGGATRTQGAARRTGTHILGTRVAGHKGVTEPVCVANHNIAAPCRAGTEPSDNTPPPPTSPAQIEHEAAIGWASYMLWDGTHSANISLEIGKGLSPLMCDPENFLEDAPSKESERNHLLTECADNER